MDNANTRRFFFLTFSIHRKNGSSWKHICWIPRIQIRWWCSFISFDLELCFKANWTNTCYGIHALPHTDNTSDEQQSRAPTIKGAKKKITIVEKNLVLIMVNVLCAVPYVESCTINIFPLWTWLQSSGLCWSFSDETAATKRKIFERFKWK